MIFVVVLMLCCKAALISVLITADRVLTGLLTYFWLCIVAVSDDEGGFVTDSEVEISRNARHGSLVSSLLIRLLRLSAAPDQSQCRDVNEVNGCQSSQWQLVSHQIDFVLSSNFISRESLRKTNMLSSFIDWWEDTRTRPCGYSVWVAQLVLHT